MVVGVSGRYATERQASGKTRSGAMADRFSSLPAAVISHSPPIPVPTWALIRPAGDTHWNQSSAQLAIGITSSATPASSPTPSSSPPPHTPKPTNPPYAPIAVCSVIALGLLLCMAAWLYRRRNRVSPSSRPPPDFEIDGGAMGSIPKHDRPTGWRWWRTLGRSRSRRPECDPGKIDAWRYPFDYEPVSTGPSSGSGASRQYYDPFRPRRNSDVVDSLGVRGQSSSGTLGQNYHSARGYSSTQNLVYGRATPSPIPNHPPIPNHSQTYPTLPPGINVNHLSSFAYGSPQPPTYGQAIPYTYPYAQPVQSTSYQPIQSTSYQQVSTYQPVQSTSTTPRSPHYVTPTRLYPRHGDQMVMIPIEHMSPDQIERLRLQFPDLRIKRKKHRRRDEQERGRARAGTDVDQVSRPTSARPRSTSARPRSTSARPRSTSVPAVVQLDEDEGPRNIVELREKYERRRRRSGSGGVVTITTRRGSVVVQGGEVVLKQASGAVRHESGERRPGSGGERRQGSGGDARGSWGDGRPASWADGRPTSWAEADGRTRVRGPRERGRAQDGGVSLMGGPPPRLG